MLLRSGWWGTMARASFVSSTAPRGCDGSEWTVMTPTERSGSQLNHFELRVCHRSLLFLFIQVAKEAELHHHRGGPFSQSHLLGLSARRQRWVSLDKGSRVSKRQTAMGCGSSRPGLLNGQETLGTSQAGGREALKLRILQGRLAKNDQAPSRVVRIFVR